MQQGTSFQKLYAAKTFTPFSIFLNFKTMATPKTSECDEIQCTEAQKESIISTLPKENGWLSSDTHPLYLYQGFWYYKYYIDSILAIQTQFDFTPSPSNIIIASTPKSGTTWLKALSFAIVTRTRFSINNPTQKNHPLLESVSHNLIPWIELSFSPKDKPFDPDLPLLATHLPYTTLPKSLLASSCKIVYICRDPKDAFISRWHYAHKLRPNKDVSEPIPLEEAFDLFCRGVSPMGPYWDHVQGYWKASLSHPKSILFLKYEDMMNDTLSHVKRLAEFMGYGFSEAEEKEGLAERIVEFCSFEKLSNLEVNKSGVTVAKGYVSISHDSFFRKGKIGDWRNYLTGEMANRIDQITAEKLGAHGLTL